MAKGELQNRDAEELGVATLPGLGELSEGIAEERGDLDGYHTLRADSDGVPPDMQIQAADREQIAQTGIGSPNVDYGVRSTYDSRPLNGRDFNLWFTWDLLDELAENEPRVLQQIWQVPKGLVAVIRSFTILQLPGTSMGDLFDGTVGLLIDKAQVDPPSVRLGPVFLENALSAEMIPYYSGQPIQTFHVADENKFVGLRWSPQNLPEPVGVAQGAYTRFGFYGQFLPKTGVPAAMQVCNKTGAAFTADTVMPPAGPSGADMVLKRRRKYDPYSCIPLVNTPE